MSKRCNGCGLDLPDAAFPGRADTKDKLDGSCRECRARRRREKYLANTAHRLAVNKASLDRHRNEHRARCRAWAKNHPLVMRAIVAARRARLALAPGRYTKQDVTRMMVLCAWRCPCGADLHAGYHVDHRIPITRGGSNWPDNLQLLCPPCNRSKSNKMPNEWRAAA